MVFYCSNRRQIDPLLLAEYGDRRKHEGKKPASRLDDTGAALPGGSASCRRSSSIIHLLDCRESINMPSLKRPYSICCLSFARYLSHSNRTTPGAKDLRPEQTSFRLFLLRPGRNRLSYFCGPSAVLTGVTYSLNPPKGRYQDRQTVRDPMWRGHFYKLTVRK